MSIKSILLLLDDSTACEKRMTVSFELARRFGAHLTGLYVIPTPSIIYGAPHAPVTEIESEVQRSQERGQASIAAFEAMAKKEGVSVEPRLVNAMGEAVSDVAALHGRYSDLLILGQNDPNDLRSLGIGVVESTLLGSGRPSLFVPYIGVQMPMLDHVIVAWDASQESTRAVHDSLPFLVEAKKVTVLVINPRIGPDGHGEQPGADIATALARHGVDVTVQEDQVDRIALGEAVLSRISDLQGGMLVMGAYGHARLRELILGGVTDTILREMTVPVLMSH